MADCMTISASAYQITKAAKELRAAGYDVQRGTALYGDDGTWRLAPASKPLLGDGVGVGQEIAPLDVSDIDQRPDR
jgi:hypothetical protein